MQLHRLTCPCFTVFFNYDFFILELVIKQALVMFSGKVETKIWSKLGLCHKLGKPKVMHIALPWPTHHQTTVCHFELNLNNHSLGLGWRNTMQLLKTCVPKLNSLIISKSGKNIHVAKKDHFMGPIFSKLLACLLMQWRLLLWYQILLSTFTAKVNHLYVREKSIHWKKVDPCSDDNNKTEFWKHKQIKLLICPRRGRENWSSKQIKINTVTGNKRSRLFPKEYKTT